MYSKSNIMKTAWQMYRQYNDADCFPFSFCLSKAWHYAKQDLQVDVAVVEPVAITNAKTQIMKVECKERMTSADYAYVRELRAQMNEVAA